MEEIWRDIIGYEGLYQISNLGRVKNRHQKIIAFGNDRFGYIRVHLWKNGISKHHLVHRLVAQAFLPNPDNLPCVNHKDENPLNNNEDNLEWCTVKYNTNYGTRNKRISEKQINDPIKSKRINQYDLDDNFIRTWPSAMEIERELGYDNGNIIKCCKGNKNYSHAYGYIWKYADKE